jgi:hypothetical protein
VPFAPAPQLFSAPLCWPSTAHRNANSCQLEPAGDDLSFVARQSRNYCSGQISGRPASLYNKGNVWTNQGAFGRQAEPEFSLEDRARVGAVMASVGRKLGLGAAIIRGIRGVGADGRQISQ